MVMVVVLPLAVTVAVVWSRVMVRVLPSRTAVMTLPWLETSAPMASNTARKGRKVRWSLTWGTASVKVSSWPSSWTWMAGASSASAPQTTRARQSPRAIAQRVNFFIERPPYILWDRRIIAQRRAFVKKYSGKAFALPLYFGRWIQDSFATQ